MINKLKTMNLNLKNLALIVLISFLCFNFLISKSEAKTYIDINSPGMRKLPIAISEFTGSEGKAISDIIKADLEFTGFFLCIDRKKYIEESTHPFNPENWSIIGAETVVKGTVTGDQDLTINVALYDVTDGKEILKKKYEGKKTVLREVAHSIANDLYKQITGEEGIFTTKIAFVAEDEGKKGLYIMDWDGSNIKRLGIRGNFVLAPHWSKDGTRIVYSSQRGIQWGIYLLDFTKMTERSIFNSIGLNITGNFSPEGDEIVFASSKDEDYGIYTLKLSKFKITKISLTRWIEISPSFSPDGKKIAFVSDRGGTPQIYIMEKNGYDVRRITFEGNYNTSPIWSPVGDNIVFVGRFEGKHHIFTVKPEGSGLTRLTNIGNNEDPSFSPNGRFIIFSSDRDGATGIYIMRDNGEIQKRITPAWLKATGPRWSPN
ncbi:MAG: Tol-Pal system beta propeller repeat protein TolB [Nitrospiraceae bacterium]|nr:Tol-Pal system beta propeller repeat protein TolB [Nitrospiraceae bacterium]